MKSLKSFFRAAKYLKPYRSRLAVAIICVICISILWAGGLGMALPALKVLISPEGLHGWAWNSMTGDRLGATVVQQKLPAGVPIDGVEIPFVLLINDVEKDKFAHEAGIVANEYIVGIDDGEIAHKVMRAELLARELALSDTGRKISLRVYNPFEQSTRNIELKLGDVEFSSRLLGEIAKKIPEPVDRAGRVPMLVGLLIVIAVITILRDFFRFCQEYLVQSTVYRSIMDIRCANYGAALKMPVTFFSQKGTSDTTSRFVQDTNELSRGLITLFGKTMAEPGKAIASLVLAFYASWKLTLIVLVAGPPAYILISKFGKRMKRASRRALEGWSGVLAVLEETLAGIRVVKAYTMEGSERKRFFRANRQLYKQQKKIASIDAATAPTVEALGIIGAMLAAGLAGSWVLRGEMDQEVFMTWMALLAAIFDPVRKLAKVVTRFQRADAAASRIFELQDREKEKVVHGAPTLSTHNQSIEFSDVTYRYPAASVDALKKINLKIQANKTVAIVGPNGCGKTTLVSLVPRLLDATNGKILIDGNDISEYSLRSLRRQIGLVTQDTVLFNATIAENIAYGLRRPKQEDVLAAAKKAFVDDFVKDMPEGYETMVGEHGATLSGGQKQRISIARAILRDPAILIFDEATSQVDSDSEQRIHQAMDEFIKGRTTLMIAHRFSTIMSAEMIVVMDDGQIVDCGTNVELLERCDIYRHLYDTQFKGQEASE